MFRTQNPYDELVTKASDESLTTEDWALNIELCDKVSDEGETGARNAISAVQKRLAHRNPNVQVFALELTNTLSENCGNNIHRELASKSFTEGLERVITDRTTNDRVRKKALQLVRKWNDTFSVDLDLGIMNELFERLRKNSEYSSVLTGSSINEPPPDEDIERTRAAAEEAEMQRVLELSKKDKGGRAATSAYAQINQSGGSSSSAARNTTASPTPAASTSTANQRASSSQVASVAATPPRPITPPLDQATRVRALYDYIPSNPTELPFNQGDIIKVIGRTYAEWWRGTLRGRVGIFPVNYVESLPVPTWEEMQREREEEDEVFGSVAKFDELLEKLKGVDVNRGDKVEESKEIEELYGYCVGLQGKISGLIQKYQSQKADLEQISNIFTQAAYQYQSMKNPQVPPPQAYAQPAPSQLAHAVQNPAYAHPPVEHAHQQVRPVVSPGQIQQTPAQQMDPQWAAYYAHQQAIAQGHSPATVPGQAGLQVQNQPPQEDRTSYDAQRREPSPSQQRVVQPSYFPPQHHQVPAVNASSPADGLLPVQNPWNGGGEPVRAGSWNAPGALPGYQQQQPQPH